VLSALAPVCALLVCGLLAWPGAARWAYDDPFITYRYAENLRAGLGFVYNPGLRVLSTTTPGYTLLLSAFATSAINLPLLSNVIGLLAILLAALILLALLPAPLGVAERVLVVLLMALLPPAYRSLGSEMPLYTLLILLALLLAERRHALLAGLIAGLATVVRPDGVLVALVVVGCFVRQPRLLALALGGAALAAGPWYGFALLYFGTPFPATLAAKQAQLSMIAGSPSFLERLLSLLGAYAANPWYWPAVALIAYGAVLLLRERRLPPLIAWALLYAASYSLLGVSGYHWYLVPLFPALVWLLGYGMRGIRLAGRRAPRLASVLLVLLLVPPLLRSGLGLREALAAAPEPRASVYARVGSWLARETPPDARVGAFEVGIVGYHSRREMIDFAGLIQPDIAAGVGASYIDWAQLAVSSYEPAYLVAPPSTGPTLEAQPWFRERYTPLQSFVVEGQSEPLVIYERR